MKGPCASPAAPGPTHIGADAHETNLNLVIALKDRLDEIHNAVVGMPPNDERIKSINMQLNGVRLKLNGMT